MKDRKVTLAVKEVKFLGMTLNVNEGVLRCSAKKNGIVEELKVVLGFVN